MSARDTFRRAMRRYERRARRMGLRSVAVMFACWRGKPDIALQVEQHARRAAREIRARVSRPRHVKTWAFLYERAADAAARLRGAS